MPIDPFATFEPSHEATLFDGTEVVSSTDLGESKTIKICRPELLKGSSDALRNAIGNYWETTTDEVGNTTMIPAAIPREFDKDLRNIHVSRGKLENEFIDRIEVNMSRITQINPLVYVPNFKVPIRLYANKDNARGDVFWKTYFTGGSFGGVVYPSLIDDTTIFYDGSFKFYNSYSIMEERVAPELTPPLQVHEVRCNYNDYDQYVESYQKWAAAQSSELLLPNYYVVLDYYTNFDVDMSEADKDIFPIQKSASYAYHFPSGSIYESAGTKPNQYLGDFFIHHPRTPADKQSMKYIQENIIFDQHWYKLLDFSGTPWGPHSSTSLPLTLANMYNISLEFPRHKAPRLPRAYNYSTLYSDTPNDFRIRNIIENNDFSSKFLELLKDLDEGTLTEVPFSAHSYDVQVETVPILSDITSMVETQSFRSFDWMQFLTYAYNFYDGALNGNYIYIGAPDPAHQTTYKDNTLYRSADNQRILSTLDQTTDLMNEYMQTEGYETSSGEYTRYGFGQLTPLASFVHPSTYSVFDAGLENHQISFMDNILEPTIKNSEVIAYKIEKLGPVITPGSTNQEIIQKFWMFNSVNAPDIMTLMDSQVKYGENYTYRVYAYAAVMNHKYRYGDFRLTKQIGTIDYSSEDIALGEYDEPSGYHERTLTESAELDGLPDLYCQQFYDPTTDLSADQLFTMSSTGEKDVSEDDFGILTDYSSLSEFNTYATSQQDISEFPHLADFHLYIEPCIKVVEIPMFSKTLKVLDNPANSPNVNPFQFIDNSHRVGFNIFIESFKESPYPIPITADDSALQQDYLHAKNLLMWEDVPQWSESPARYIEIFKTIKKPTSFSSFSNNLASKIDLRIPNENFNFADHVAADKLIPNTEYYYVFRFINENGIPGPLSQIIIAELVDDGGYIFSLFDTLDSSEFNPDTLTSHTAVVKKMFQLEPNVEQLSLDYSEADFTKTASSQLDKIQIGPDAERLWDKKFKIRLTSKKTGKKLDLNVTYRVQTRDYTTESESVT